MIWLLLNTPFLPFKKDSFSLSLTPKLIKSSFSCLLASKYFIGSYDFFIDSTQLTWINYFWQKITTRFSDLIYYLSLNIMNVV